MHAFIDFGSLWLPKMPPKSNIFPTVFENVDFVKFVLPCRRELNFHIFEGSRRKVQEELQNDSPERLWEPLGRLLGTPGRLKNEPKSGPRAPRRDLMNFFRPEAAPRGSISAVRVPAAARDASGSDFGASGGRFSLIFRRFWNPLASDLG